MHLAGISDPLSFADLRHVELPTLLLSGETSPLPARRLMHHLANTFPRATSATVAGAGHMSPMTHVSVVSQHLAHHFSAHPADREH
jgi:pimeloyl-ACP methyl ester carboxylesterase